MARGYLFGGGELNRKKEFENSLWKMVQRFFASTTWSFGGSLFFRKTEVATWQTPNLEAK